MKTEEKLQAIKEHAEMLVHLRKEYKEHMLSLKEAIEENASPLTIKNIRLMINETLTDGKAVRKAYDELLL